MSELMILEIIMRVCHELRITMYLILSPERENKKKREVGDGQTLWGFFAGQVARS